MYRNLIYLAIFLESYSSALKLSSSESRLNFKFQRIHLKLNPAPTTWMFTHTGITVRIWWHLCEFSATSCTTYIPHYAEKQAFIKERETLSDFCAFFVIRQVVHLNFPLRSHHFFLWIPKPLISQASGAQEHTRSGGGFWEVKEVGPLEVLGIPLRLGFSAHLPFRHADLTGSRGSGLLGSPCASLGVCICALKSPHPPPIPLFIFKIAQVWTQVLFSCYIKVIKYYEAE